MADMETANEENRIQILFDVTRALYNAGIGLKPFAGERWAAGVENIPNYREGYETRETISSYGMGSAMHRDEAYEKELLAKVYISDYRIALAYNGSLNCMALDEIELFLNNCGYGEIDIFNDDMSSVVYISLKLMGG